MGLEWKHGISNKTKKISRSFVKQLTASRFKEGIKVKPDAIIVNYVNFKARVVINKLYIMGTQILKQDLLASLAFVCLFEP